MLYKYIHRGICYIDEPSKESASLRVLAFAGIIGVFVLLPINYTGDQLGEFNIANISTGSLDIFTISNVKSGSGWLWVHFCTVYLVTVFVCGLLYYEYNYVSDRRVQYFYTSKPQPHQFTVLVRGVLVPPGGSISSSVDSFFTEYHPSTYLSHTVIQRTSKLPVLMNDANKLYRRLTRLRTETGERNSSRRSGFLGTFGRKVDLVDQYEKQLGDIEESMRTQRGASLGEAVGRCLIPGSSCCLCILQIPIWSCNCFGFAAVNKSNAVDH